MIAQLKTLIKVKLKQTELRRMKLRLVKRVLAE